MQEKLISQNDVLNILQGQINSYGISAETEKTIQALSSVAREVETLPIRMPNSDFTSVLMFSYATLDYALSECLEHARYHILFIVSKPIEISHLAKSKVIAHNYYAVWTKEGSYDNPVITAEFGNGSKITFIGLSTEYSEPVNFVVAHPNTPTEIMSHIQILKDN